MDAASAIGAPRVLTRGAAACLNPDARDVVDGLKAAPERAGQREHHRRAVIRVLPTHPRGGSEIRQGRAPGLGPSLGQKVARGGSALGYRYRCGMMAA